jgi:hypothetical protein
MLKASVFALLFALTGFTREAPVSLRMPAPAPVLRHDFINEFPAGTYLGEGRLSSTWGQDTSYSTMAIVDSEDLQFTIVREGELFSYALSFAFYDGGFFDVEATDSRAPDVNYYGRGYCKSVQCHFDIALDDRLVEETITFATWESKIYTVGSMWMAQPDENGDSQGMSWEERFLLVPSNNAMARP